MNVTSKIELRVFEEHIMEKKKTLLFTSQQKPRSPNPLSKERWLINKYILV